MRKYVTILFVTLLSMGPAAAETAAIEASRDATLIEDSDGKLANGSGPAIFVGRTSQAKNSVRRALLYFDVVAVVPERAIIERVALTLFMSQSNPASREMALYRVQADWSEGLSSASGGGGAPSGPGDVTWLHTLYDTEFWAHRGGHFIGRSSAELDVAGSGFYTWETTNHLVQDVRLWRSATERNFGWILIGDETTRRTAKSFASREFPDPAFRPILEVTYRMPSDRQHR